MLEQMKSVSNPLTIIALFAALAEVAGTVAIKLVTPEMQSTFIWFVMIFPTLIVVLFFITLNFNQKVLYAPGDFKNEENYLAAMNATKSLGIEKVQTMIAEAIPSIVTEVMKTIPTNGPGDRNKVEEIVNDKLKPVQDAVEDVKGDVYSDYVQALNQLNDVLQVAATRVWTTLKSAAKPLTVAGIAAETKMTREVIRRALSFLAQANLVDTIRDGGGGVKFVATDPK